jgi:hypothetical protein
MKTSIHIQLVCNNEYKKLHVKALRDIIKERSVKITCTEWHLFLKNIEKYKSSDEDSPDIIQTGKGWAEYQNNKHLFMKLDEVGMSASLHSEQGLYSAKWFYDPILLFYDKKYVSRDSISNREAFRYTCEQLKNSMKYKHVLGIIGQKEWSLLHFFISLLWGAEGEIYMNARTCGLKYDDKFLEVMRMYGSLLVNFSNIEEQLNPHDAVSYRKMRDRFIDRKDYYLFFDSFLHIPKFISKYGKMWSNLVGVAPLPTRPNSDDHVAFLGGSDLSVCLKNYNSVQMRIISECLERITSLQEQATFCTKTGHVPSDAKARELFVEYFDGQYGAELNAFIEQIVNNYRLYNISGQNEESLLRAISEIIRESYGPYSSGITQEAMLDILKSYNLEKNYQWDVALSFAGQDRDMARCFRDELELKGMRVYFHEDDQSRLLARYLDKELEIVYGGRSKYFLALTSKSYRLGKWPMFELKIAIEEASIRNEPYIIECRIDAIKIEQLPEQMSYIDLIPGSRNKKSISEAVDIIVKKINLNH